MAMIIGENAQTCGPGFLYAFDLIEINGDDLRREPLEVRTATLASVLAKAAPGLRLNEHIEADGPTVFAHACRMGLEGIVSKRKASSYRSGRSPDWLKSKAKCLNKAFSSARVTSRACDRRLACVSTP
jgi:bifunctional non-homologous end joining protein LigD